MAALTKIGLDEAKSEQLADELNNLLATYMIFYQNARGFHWNIKGDKFFELHVKFEELYTNLLIPNMEKVAFLLHRLCNGCGTNILPMPKNVKVFMHRHFRQLLNN